VWPRSAPTNTAPEPCRGPLCDTFAQSYRVARSVGSVGVTCFNTPCWRPCFEGAPIHSILDTASIRTFFWSPQPAKKLILRKAEQSYHRAETSKHCEMGWPFLCRVSPQLICQRTHVHQFRCGVSIYTCILARGLRKPPLEERNFSSCRLLIDCCNLLENSMQSPCKSSSSFSTNSVHRSRRRIPSSTLNEKRRYHQRIGCRACGQKHTLS